MTIAEVLSLSPPFEPISLLDDKRSKYRAIAKSPTTSPPPSTIPKAGFERKRSGKTVRSTDTSNNEAIVNVTTGRCFNCVALGLNDI